MKNEIVHSKKEEVFTTTMIISEMLEVPHHHLLRTVESIVKRLTEQPPPENIVFSQKFIKTTFINKMGRTYKMYELNEQAYMKLAMKLGGYEKAEIVQDAIIQAFSMMKRALLQHENATWINARQQGKAILLRETSTIKIFVEYATKQGSKSANFYYSNITKMTNKALEMLKQSTYGTPLRELATIQELGHISTIENLATECIKKGMIDELPYKMIYQYTKDKVNDLVDLLSLNKQLT